MTTTTKRRSSLDRFLSEYVWGGGDGSYGYIVLQHGGRVWLLDPDAAVREVGRLANHARPWGQRGIVGLFFDFDYEGRFDGASYVEVRWAEDGWTFLTRHTGRRGNPEYPTLKAALERAIQGSPRAIQVARTAQEARAKEEQERREGEMAQARAFRKTEMGGGLRLQFDEQFQRVRHDLEAGVNSLATRFQEMAEQVKEGRYVHSWVPHQTLTDTLQALGAYNALHRLRNSGHARNLLISDEEITEARGG